MDKTGFFQAYFENAKINCILVMDTKGTIIEVSPSFTKHFGYKNEEIRGQHLSILFTEKDREIQKPHHELEKVLATGQANDENFVVHQNGLPIWCTGESVCVPTNDGHFIIKDIVNLQTQKQVQLLLSDTEELLETVFKSTAEVPLLILDGSMRIHKVNEAFKKLFQIENDVLEHAKLSELNHPFWNTQALKNELRTLIVNKVPITNSNYTLQSSTGESRTIAIKSRCIQKNGASDFKFYIMLEELVDTGD